MSAGSTNKFTDTFNSANPNVAKVTSSRTALATTLACDNLAGWPTASKVHFSTYQIDTNNAVVSGTQIDWEGVVSGNNIGSLVRKAGATDAGNSVGDIVEMNPTASWGHDLYSGLTAEHNQDGTHAAVTATSLTLSGNLTTADSSTSILDSSSNELVKFSNTASAVNEVTVANAATGNAPQISATGGDTNIDVRIVPKGTGNVKRGATGGSIDWWEEIGRTTLGSAGDTITVSSIPARKYLTILISVIATGMIELNLRFNNDSSSNYAYLVSTLNAAQGTSASASALGLGTATGVNLFSEVSVLNMSANEKMVKAQTLNQGSAGAANAPSQTRELYGKWVNTSTQITRVDLVNAQSGDYAAGSEVIVLGHD